MFAAAISLVGLAATVYLVLREARPFALSRAPLPKALLVERRLRSFRVFLTIWAPLALVAQTSRSPL